MRTAGPVSRSADSSQVLSLEMSADAWHMSAPQGLPREMLSRDTQMVWYASRQPPTSGMALRFTYDTGPDDALRGEHPAA